MQTTTLFGLDFFCGSRAAFIHLLHDKLTQTAAPFLIFTPNPEQIVLANQDADFRRLLHQADVLIPDGSGLIIASRLKKVQPALTERIAGADVVADILRSPDLGQHRILVIGGRDYDRKKLVAGWQIRDAISDRAAASPKTIFWLAGFTDVKHPTNQEEQLISDTIRQLRPEIIFVALGAPAQEKFAYEHLQLFAQAQVKVVMVVGGVFDFLTGQVKRAPQWIQKMGFEWLYRLIQEPWRWRRQLRLTNFIWLALTR